MNKRSLKSKVCGFTLIELAVTVTIMLVIMSIVIFNNKKFNDSLLITNLAYDVALSIRESQVFGVSVKGAGVGSAQDFNVGYGVHFDLDISKVSFKKFVDRFEGISQKGDYSFDEGELLDTLEMKRGNHIEEIYAVDSYGGRVDISKLDIVFVRPNPDAHFSVGGESQSYSSVRIILISPQEVRKQIEIGSTGQISIQTI